MCVRVHVHVCLVSKTIETTQQIAIQSSALPSENVQMYLAGSVSNGDEVKYIHVHNKPFHDKALECSIR